MGVKMSQNSTGSASPASIAACPMHCDSMTPTISRPGTVGERSSRSKKTEPTVNRAPRKAQEACTGSPCIQIW